MARALELLRAAWPGLAAGDIAEWASWARARLLPNIDFFVNVLSAYPPGMDKRLLMYGEGATGGRGLPVH